MLTRPYYDEEGNPVLKESVIVVADILGFKQRIKSAHENEHEEETLIELHAALSDALPNIQDPSGLKWRIKIWSDNLILSFPSLVDNGLVFEFPQAVLAIAHYQQCLASKGIFLRGGLSVGRIHVGDELIFGMPIIEASEAEKVGLPPRIIMLDSAKCFLNKQLTGESKKSVLSCIRSDGDTAFVDYLSLLDYQRDRLRTDLIIAHKKQIEDQSASNREKPDVLCKLEWVARYHNEFCETSRHYNEERFKIVLKAVSSKTA